MNIKAGFFKIAKFSNVVGIIDGTQIPIQGTSTDDEHLYVCRKGYHAINVQAVVDHDLRFVYIYIYIIYIYFVTAANNKKSCKYYCKSINMIIYMFIKQIYEQYYVFYQFVDSPMQFASFLVPPMMHTFYRIVKYSM